MEENIQVGNNTFSTNNNGEMFITETIKENLCEGCGEAHSKQALNKKNNADIDSANLYCQGHLTRYSNHSIKPIWCEDCGQLEIYQINVLSKSGGERRPTVRN
ncbi:hypothetical protein H8D85_02060 [bacterium]|nr:hypothetical protein [bacterium]